jgi:hypothetical protein
LLQRVLLEGLWFSCFGGPETRVQKVGIFGFEAPLWSEERERRRLKVWVCGCTCISGFVLDESFGGLGFFLDQFRDLECGVTDLICGSFVVLSLVGYLELEVCDLCSLSLLGFGWSVDWI